ncbi:MAG: hypothetical protein NTZ12_05455 [Candidatus Aminicenantes bacterium]|nr:hypothetical protein [Candidatus Aminicenantes bacterium]
MKKLTLIFFALLFTISLLPAGTIANVIAHKDLLLTIDRGTTDGVEAGMKGIVNAVYKEPSGEYTINIGIFTVKKVSPRTAEVLINKMGPGLNPDDARYVVFEQDLLPIETKAEPRAEPKSRSMTPEKPAENADWYLDQGDKEAEAGNVRIALQHYQKALALAPGSLVAKEKCSEMQKEIDLGERKGKFSEYLEKADANYEKNDVKFAFLYLVEGLRIYPEGTAEIQSRLTPMAEKYPQEIDALLTEKSKELKDVRKQIDAMLGRTETTNPAPAETKLAETKPAAVKTSVQPNKYSEPFLQKIAGKADKIQQNDKGFWEAVFPRNITMIYIPEGEFSIGSPAKEGDADEHPRGLGPR